MRQDNQASRVKLFDIMTTAAQRAAVVTKQDTKLSILQNVYKIDWNFAQLIVLQKSKNKCLVHSNLVYLVQNF